MVPMGKFSLAYGFVVITGVPLELGMWNLVQRLTINIPTQSRIPVQGLSGRQGFYILNQKKS